MNRVAWTTWFVSNLSKTMQTEKCEKWLGHARNYQGVATSTYRVVTKKSPFLVDFKLIPDFYVSNSWLTSCYTRTLLDTDIFNKQDCLVIPEVLCTRLMAKGGKNVAQLLTILHEDFLQVKTTAHAPTVTNTFCFSLLFSAFRYRQSTKQPDNIKTV